MTKIQRDKEAIRGDIVTSVSICICAYNEESNIRKTITALLEQERNKISIGEIIIVSASTDATNMIVKDMEKVDSRVKLIAEKERRGKASAINTFINEANFNICVLIGADIIPASNAIEQLCLPFLKEEDKIGMTGARVIPSNSTKKFMGFMGNIEWEMAHRLSLISPKLGECVAFKRVLNENNHTPRPILDPHTAVDEAYIEFKVLEMGYKLKYVPTAVVYNKTSETLKDAIKQRVRIYNGHLHLKNTTHYSVSSMNMWYKGKLALELYYGHVRFCFWMPVVVIIETMCIMKGVFDFYIMKRNPYIWKISKSTKAVVINDSKEVY